MRKSIFSIVTRKDNFESTLQAFRYGGEIRVKFIEVKIKFSGNGENEVEVISYSDISLRNEIAARIRFNLFANFMQCGERNPWKETDILE